MAQTPPTFARPVKNAVYNVNTLSWEPMTQPGGVAGGGDASAANQVTGNASLASIDAKLTNPLPVSAATMPLPTNAATESGHLAAIDTATAKIPSQGQALAANSTPVVLTAIQVAALTPPAAITGFATSTQQDTGNASLASIDSKLTNPLPVSAATLPLPTGAATETGNLATIATRVAPLVYARGAASASLTGPMVQGELTIAEPYYTADGVLQPLSLDLNGRLRVSTGDSPPVYEGIDDTLANASWSQGQSSSLFDVGNTIVKASMWEQ